MHITESSDNFMRDVKNYIAPRCAEISPFYCINIYKIWLNRHCSTSVNTGKAISGDVSANKKISKIHGEYRFNYKTSDKNSDDKLLTYQVSRVLIIPVNMLAKLLVRSIIAKTYIRIHVQVSIL